MIAEALIAKHINTPINNLDGVDTIDGWVKVYLDDLKRNSRAGIRVDLNTKAKFPIVATHVLDDVFKKWNLATFTLQRTVVISGAVDVKDRTNIDSRLQSLYRSVILNIVKSLDPVKDASKLSFHNAKFSIPDDDSEYAMFELMITTNTQEDISRWELST